MVALGAIGGSPSASVCSSPGRAPACPCRSALCLLVPCVSVGLDAGPGISVSVEQPGPDAQAAHPERCGHQQDGVFSMLLQRCSRRSSLCGS